MQRSERFRMYRGPRASTRDWFQIKAADDGASAEIRIYDAIDSWGEPFGISAQEIIGQIDALDVDRITVAINSPGGEVHDGLTIANHLRRHPAHVTARVDGVAASIASVIMAAADTRLMHSESMVMVHRAWGMCVGNCHDMIEMADALQVHDDAIGNAYRRTMPNASEADLSAMLDRDTWIGPEKALELGFATGLVEIADQSEQARAKFDLSDFEHVPEGLAKPAKNVFDPADVDRAAAAIEAAAADAFEETTNNDDAEMRRRRLAAKTRQERLRDLDVEAA